MDRLFVGYFGMIYKSLEKDPSQGVVETLPGGAMSNGSNVRVHRQRQASECNFDLLIRCHPA